LKPLGNIQRVERALRTLGVSFSAKSVYDALVLAHSEIENDKLLKGIYAWRNGRQFNVNGLDEWDNAIVSGIVRGLKAEEVIPSLLSRIGASMERELVKVEELEDRLNAVIVLGSFSPVIALLFGLLSFNVTIYFKLAVIITVILTVIITKIMLKSSLFTILRDMPVYFTLSFVPLFLLLEKNDIIASTLTLLATLVIYVRTPRKETLSELLNYYEGALEEARERLVNGNLVKALESIASIKGHEEDIALKTLYMLRNGRNPRIKGGFVTRFIYTTAKRSNRYAVLTSQNLLKVTRDSKRIVAKYEAKIRAVRLRLLVTSYALETSLGVLCALALNPLSTATLGATYLSSHLTVMSAIAERKDIYRQALLSTILYAITYTLTRRIVQIFIL